MKVLFALLFPFFPFTAMAGSHTVLTIPPYELEDWFEGSTKQDAIPLQITNIDEIIEEEAVATFDPTDEEDIIGRTSALQRSSGNTHIVIVKQETRLAQTMPAQPALDWRGEVVDLGEEDAGAGVEELDEVPVGVIHPNDERRSARKDRKILQDIIEPKTIRAKVVFRQSDNVTAPREDANVSVAAPSSESNSGRT